MEQKRIKKKMCHTIFSSSILFLIITSHYTIAGPVIRPSRMVREIYPEIEQEIPDSSQTQVCIVGDVVYGAGESVPAEQPCLKCACAPPEVRCETEICVQQPGCKTIHRPNKCCPDYQCECQHEGKSYANGERLPASPGGECLVCYCRGGEVQCAEVGCYTRSDCEPRYVSGQCCPKYDHCPPRESNTNQHDPPNGGDQDIISSWPMASVPENLTSLETEEGSGDLSSDDFYSSSTTPNSIQSDEPKRSQTPITFSIKDYDSKTKKPDLSPPEKTDKSTQTDLDHRPQITIQEVIPVMTEFKITSPPQKEVAQKAVSISPINPVTYKGVEVTSNPNDNDVESYASEKTEVYVHPSPVLRIGDQLLFIKHGQLVPEKDASTPSPVITLIGAEGLQIGLGSGELLDHEIIPVNREESTSNPVGKQLDVTSSSSDQSFESTSSSEISTSSPIPSSSSEQSSFDLENESTTSVLPSSSPNPTETSSPKLEVLSTEDIFESSSKEASLPDTSAEYIPLNSTDFDYNLTETKSSEFEFSSTESLTNITDDESLKSTEISTDLSTDSSSPKIETSTPEGKTPNMEYIPEENPYYPPIPEDIMNLGHDDAMPDSSTTKRMPDVSSESSASTENFDFENNSSVESSDIPKSRNRILLHMKSVEDKEFATPTSDVLPADKILPDVLEIRSNKSIPKNTTQEWLKTEDPVKILIPLINEKAALPQELLNEPVPSDFLNDEPISTILNSFKTIDQILTTTETSSDQPKTESSSTSNLPEATVTLDDSQKVVLPTQQEQLHSKETIEDELYSSEESTTVKSQPMPFLENDDASIEIIQNDSGVDNTDLVEMLPGFERSTPKAIETSEEHLNVPKDEVEMISKSAEEPESHLDLTVESVVKQPESHMVEVKETREELKDFHEEIQKRDVVKKVLKDTFDNPKENIRTELIGPEEGHTLNLAQDETDDELNVVKPDFHDLSTRSLNASIFIPTSSTNSTVQIPNVTADTEVIQKVATDNAVKSSDSTDTLDTGALGVLRDFFQSQFRHYQDSRSTTE